MTFWQVCLPGVPPACLTVTHPWPRFVVGCFLLRTKLLGPQHCTLISALRATFLGEYRRGVSHFECVFVHLLIGEASLLISLARGTRAASTGTRGTVSNWVSQPRQRSSASNTALFFLSWSVHSTCSKTVHTVSWLDKREEWEGISVRSCSGRQWRYHHRPPFWAHYLSQIIFLLFVLFDLPRLTELSLVESSSDAKLSFISFFLLIFCCRYVCDIRDFFYWRFLWFFFCWIQFF